MELRSFVQKIITRKTRIWYRNLLWRWVSVCGSKCIGSFLFVEHFYVPFINVLRMWMYVDEYMAELELIATRCHAVRLSVANLLYTAGVDTFKSIFKHE